MLTPFCATEPQHVMCGRYLPVTHQIFRVNFVGTPAQTCKKGSETLEGKDHLRLQSAMAMLAAVTLLSLLVRGGVERNPGPDFEQALENVYIRINLRLSQTERQFTLLTMELRDLNVRFGSTERRIDFIEQECVTTDVMETVLTKLEDRIEHCELYSRRKNLTMSGVGEDRTDYHDSCKRVVFGLPHQCLPSKTWTEDDIVRAHRLGKVSLSRETNRPRPIIARFKLWQDKMRVVANKSAR